MPPLHLPSLNAALNGTAALLLCAGWWAVHRAPSRDPRSPALRWHARLMVAAFLVSSAFLASYLYYHFTVPGPTRYHGQGWRRPAYLALLSSHTVLAVVNLPLVLRTLWLAHRRRFAAHRRIARWTLPIWMYVSVTGVLVYLVLYRWNPPAPPG